MLKKTKDHINPYKDSYSPESVIGEKESVYGFSLFLSFFGIEIIY